MNRGACFDDGVEYIFKATKKEGARMKNDLQKFGTPFARLTIQCPFYKFERDGKLYCEGGRIKFMNNEHRKEFISEHCGRLESWGRCTLAMHLNREYERMGN